MPSDLPTAHRLAARLRDRPADLALARRRLP
jgi:hypothetical protein